jgi:hypothetical protein
MGRNWTGVTSVGRRRGRETAGSDSQERKSRVPATEVWRRSEKAVRAVSRGS